MSEQPIEIEAEVSPDGTLHIELPAGSMTGRVRVTVQKMTEQPEASEMSQAELDELKQFFEEHPNGLGLTAAEIMQSPYIGVLSDDDIDGEAFVEQLRRGHKRYSW